MKKEIPYLHALRCMAMLLVIALHCASQYIVSPSVYGTTSWWFLLVVNAFTRSGVPLFFMISGYLLLTDTRSREIGRFYKKRLPRILIPLLVWNVAYFIYFSLTSHMALNGLAFISQIIDSGSAYHLWFVYALFGMYLLTPFLKRIVDTCSIKQLIWLEVLVCFAGTLRPIFNVTTHLYLNLFEPLANGYLGYFLLGYILGNAQIKKQGRAILYILGIAALAASVIANNLASSPQDIRLITNGGYNISHFLTASAIFVLFKSVSWPEGRAVRAISGLSGITFGVYLVHVMVLDLLQRYVLPPASPALTVSYLFVATTVISVVIAWILSKIKPIRKYIM